MKTKLARLLALFLVMAGGAFNAGASVDVYYKIGGTADVQTFNVTFNNSIPADYYNGSVLAGGIMISQTGTGYAVNNSMPLNYVTVCTDFEGSLYVGSTYAYSTPSAPFTSQTGIDPTWNNPTLAIQNAAYLFYTYGQLTSGGIGGTVENMAALQLAVWMSLYDTGNNGLVTVNAGSEFYVSASNNGGNDTTAIAQALTWVGALNATNYDYTGNILKPDSTTASGPDQGNPDHQLPQELLIAVPEPATVFAGVLLLLPLGAGTIRFLCKSQAK